MVTSQRDHAVLAQGWQEPGFQWNNDDWNGIDLTRPSPTCDGETLGESIRRVGNDFFEETQDLNSLGPNKATYAEAKDLFAAFPESSDLINGATRAGMVIRSQHENPVQQMLEEMEQADLEARGIDEPVDAGRGAVHPIGDINPRYANLVGDVVGGAGSPVVGRVTSTDY